MPLFETTSVSGDVERLTQIGTVHGDVLLKLSDDSKLIERLLEQNRKTCRKKWRPLPFFRYIPLPCLHEENEPRALSFYFAHALRTTLLDTKYLQCSALIRKGQISDDFAEYRVYDVLCAQPDAIGAMNTDRRVLLHNNRQRIEAAIQAGDAGALYEIEGSDFQRYKESLKDNWSLLWGVLLTPNWSTMTVTYDATEKNISFLSKQESDISLESFPGKLSSTSEMLSFVGATIGARSLVVNDFDVWMERSSGLRMMIDLLDRGFVDLGQLRINVDDLEEWDYLNPRFDAELERRRDGGQSSGG